MPAERWDSAMNPFGGMEQITWSQDGNSIFYTCKKMVGKDYTLSTNSEIYEYNTTSKITRNLTFGNLGYDTNPLASADGKYLANLAMKRNGFEADKNDIVIRDIRSGSAQNLTEGIDLTIADYIWTPDSKKIYFLAVINATEQIFEIEVATKKWKQITD